MSGRIYRAFIAFSLSEEIKSCCLELQRELKKKSFDAVFVDRNNLHVTILFLGNKSEFELNQISIYLKTFNPKINDISFHAKCISGFGRPLKVIYLGLEDISGIGANISSKIIDQCGIEKDKKTNWVPHITLARVKAGKINTFPPVLEKITFKPKSLSLFTSLLLPNGPKYTQWQ